MKARFGRGFSERNLEQMRLFYVGWPISQTLSAKSNSTVDEGRGYNKLLEKSQTMSAEFDKNIILKRFPLPWSHYVRLLSVSNSDIRAFYESEALRGGWSVRQLDRQVSTLFYERTLLSENKAAMLKKGTEAKLEDAVTPEEEIKDPFVLEFLNLKDEYSENDLEEALVQHLEKFLIELGKFTHADAGQMHLYLNYARENWTHKDENPPVGLILCAEKDAAVARYALEGLPNKVLAAEYRMALPDEKVLAAELEHTRRMLEGRTMKAE